jgi:GAF domain-containing protein
MKGADTNMKPQSEYLRLFLDITQAITASLDPKEVFDLIVTKIPQVVHVDAATIRLLDPSRQKLILTSPWPLPSKEVWPYKMPSTTKRCRTC